MMWKGLVLIALVAAITAGPASAEEECFVPMQDWQPRELVVQLAADNGWTVRRIKIDDGCYEIKGRDSDGQEIEATVHPATLEIISLEHERDDDHD